MTDCIEWQAARDPRGYGRVRRDGRTQLAHRLAWIDANGPVPDGLCVLHRCDNPPCINVEHLFLGTRADNVDDMIAKGRRRQGYARGQRNAAFTHPERIPRGVLHGNAKLTDDSVREAREAYDRGETVSSLARRLRVHWKTLKAAIDRRTWRHVWP